MKLDYVVFTENGDQTKPQTKTFHDGRPSEFCARSKSSDASFRSEAGWRLGSLRVILPLALVSLVALAFTSSHPWVFSRGGSERGCLRTFPAGFHWSAALASYQSEGGVNLTRRSPSIWDDFCIRAWNCNGTQTLHWRPGCQRLDCADVADDVFHRYRSDIAMMADMRLTAHRFSISWSRIMTWSPVLKKMVPNQPGIEYYRSYIKELLRHNIEPHVTLYHWDLPLALQRHVGEPGRTGWLSREIVRHFRDFAELAFLEFGHIVPLWFTINEPYTFSVFGYSLGIHAPGHTGSPTETYLVGHHALLAHATAVELYRRMRHRGLYVRSDGRISVVLIADLGYAHNASELIDVRAAQAYNEFMFDWFLHPLVYGTYPPAMIARAGAHLPNFPIEDQRLVQGSLDGFIGINHYTVKLVTECDSIRSSTPCESLAPGWPTDLHVDSAPHPRDSRASSNPHCSIFQGYPAGYGSVLDYVHRRYPDLQLMLTENGWCGDARKGINDLDQLWYFQAYIAEVHAALVRGIPIIGYTAWSLLDNYEWGSFLPRFGLVHVDYSTLKRTPKASARWYAQVAGTNCLDDDPQNGLIKRQANPRIHIGPRIGLEKELPTKFPSV